VVAYLYWDLIWADGKGLVTLEFPWDPGRWTDPAKGYIKNKHFYSFKQFSAFVHPGWKRIGLDYSSNEAAALAFVNPGGDSATTVLINRSMTDTLAFRLGIPGYRIHESAVYSTSENEDCVLKGALADSLLILAPHSVTTVDMRITPYDPEDDTVAPSVPQNLQLVEATPTSLALTWDPSTDSIGVAGYRIFLDDNLAGSVQQNNYTITGLIPETTYELKVSAYDEAQNESALSSGLLATTLVMPDTVPPVIEVTDTVYADGMGVIEVTSSEPGMVYLVPDGTAGELAMIREASLDSAEISDDSPVLIGIAGLTNGSYDVYAADTVMNLSEPATVEILGVGVQSRTPVTFQTYPNPFSTTTTLKFHSQQDQWLHLTLFDSHGREVRKEFLGFFSSGQHQITFQRKGLESGLYLFRLENEKGKGDTGRWIIRD
jgi:chitodextrinase